MSNIDSDNSDFQQRRVLSSAARPWVNLWLVVHFFAFGLALITNFAASDLQRRFQRVLAPYSVLLHQDYGNVPLEMTRDEQLGAAFVFQLHEVGKGEDEWHDVNSPGHAASVIDSRWQTFEHFTGVAAHEKNEPVIAMLCEHCVHAQRLSIDGQADRVRLIRRGHFSYRQDRSHRAGDLPAEESAKPQTVFEYRVVRLPGERPKLLSVLESTRTSKALLSGNIESQRSTSGSAPPIDPLPVNANSSPETPR